MTSLGSQTEGQPCITIFSSTKLGKVLCRKLMLSRQPSFSNLDRVIILKASEAMGSPSRVGRRELTLQLVVVLVLDIVLVSAYQQVKGALLGQIGRNAISNVVHRLLRVISESLLKEQPVHYRQPIGDQVDLVQFQDVQRNTVQFLRLI